MSDRRVSFSSPSVGSSSGGATSSTSSSTTAHPHRPASTRSNGPVTPADVHTAFTFFDVAKRGAINVEELKARVTMFYPALTAVELQAMMMGKDELTEADLYELLASHTLTNYDPVAEAFKVALSLSPPCLPLAGLSRTAARLTSPVLCVGCALW